MILVELQSFSEGSGGVEVPAGSARGRQPPSSSFSCCCFPLPQLLSLLRLSRSSSGGRTDPEGPLRATTCVSGSLYLRVSHGKDGVEEMTRGRTSMWFWFVELLRPDCLFPVMSKERRPLPQQQIPDPHTWTHTVVTETHPPYGKAASQAFKKKKNDLSPVFRTPDL